jgi:2,3-bisphosphoglycerate-independent phosphoglycerate mutase
MRKIILIVMDGWGCAPPGPGNFISQAKTPHFNFLSKCYPCTQNKCSGNAVGLPEGTQGNSEVGHLHLGAGRIVMQKYEKINRSIRDKSFFENEALIKAMKHAKKNNSKLHIIGLCSDEAIHAHTDHLLALLDLAKQEGLNEAYIHFIADGRDVPEKSAQKYIDLIEAKAGKLGLGKIASVIGRYYAMDRDKNWDRTKLAYDLLVAGKGIKAKSASEAVEKAYARGDKTDYYIQPTVITGKDNLPLALIEDKDSVIFFNFRTDRPRQLTECFIGEEFRGFNRESLPKVWFTTFTQYDSNFGCPFAFGDDNVNNNLGQVIAKNNLKQLRIAETEKYPHVTFFFNSQIEEPNKGEERIMVSSPKVPSYDQAPEMSALRVNQKLLERIDNGGYDFILVNYANCDLVGHSAVKSAIIKAVETVDDCVGKVVDRGLKNGYTVLITADHGNAEDKIYPDGKPKPSHSLNKVPFIVVSEEEALRKIKLRQGGGLSDVAPTILEIMGIKKPKEMSGESLILNSAI